MEANPSVREALTEVFGPESYQADGSLNRIWLGDLVFHNQRRLEELNAIVHPMVIEGFQQFKKETRSGLLVHEAALIYEVKLDDHLDAVCVVSAPEEVRIKRVMERDHLSRDAILARIQSQLPQEEMERQADVVLINDGNLHQLRKKTRTLYERIMSEKTLTPNTFTSLSRL